MTGFFYLYTDTNNSCSRCSKYVALFFSVVSVTDKEAKQNHSVLRHSKAALLAINWEILSVPRWTNNLN